MNGKCFVALVTYFCSFSLIAKEHCIDVYFPTNEEKYRNTIFSIIKGIKQQGQVKVHHHHIDDFDYHCSINIAIGRKSFKVLQNKTHPLVVGGIFAQHDQIQLPGISLIPHPKVIFKPLIRFRRSLKTVWTLYTDKSQGIIPIAESEAKNLGLKLKAIKVNNNHEAASLIRSLVISLDGETESLWISHDRNVIPSEASLNSILKNAWERNFIFFSSQAWHVKRGALYSMVPDHFEMGRQLAILANRCLNDGCQNTEFLYLTAVKTSVNTRTAQHLNISLTNDIFDIVYPRN